MRYKPRQYAEALADALVDTEPETVSVRMKHFLALLVQHRMLGKAENIVRAAERLLARRQGANRIVLESAAPASEALRREVADIFAGKAWIEERVNPGLLAGVRILIDDETLVDASGKRRLAEMFHHA